MMRICLLNEVKRNAESDYKREHMYK